MTRAILSWRILKEDLIGTYHVPETPGTGTSLNADGIGVLILNAGPAPRAGNSDLSVHIGDCLAACGIPVFRFDLPGLGDSTGSVPLEMQAYWRDVLRGRNDAATRELVHELRTQFGIERIVLGGLCAAVVPTLRAADHDQSGIAGVILLEPSFQIVDHGPGSPSVGIPAAPRGGIRGKLRMSLSYREWLHFLTGANRVAAAAGPLRALLLRALQRSVGHSLSRDMNVPLCMQWQSSLRRGTHSLVVVAGGLASDRDVARIMEVLHFDGPGINELVRVPHTNHIFTHGRARDAVVAAVEQWVGDRFGAGGVPTAVRSRP